MAKYHRYVFDTQTRRLVGDFEAMYAVEDAEEFDSWHSYDARHLRLRLVLLADYNFSSVLEIGRSSVDERCYAAYEHAFLRAANAVNIAPWDVIRTRANMHAVPTRRAYQSQGPT